ncbi:MAG: hypothetical protein ABI298_09090 [Acidimicrobiales bacterium]
MAAVEVTQSEEFEGTQSRTYLRLVSTSEVYRTGPSLARRRASRARMMQRRRRTLVALLLVTGLVILSWPGHAFGGTTGGGLSTDLANSSVLASGMEYVVQPGDTVHSIATLMNPVDPSVAQGALDREIHSSVVVPGEHVLIP